MAEKIILHQVTEILYYKSVFFQLSIIRSQ